MNSITKNFSLLNINLVTAVKSGIYFNLTTDIIRNNCNFNFYYNKADITPAVLDGGDEIILANWPNDKHIICNINNDYSSKNSKSPLCFSKQKYLV